MNKNIIHNTACNDLSGYHLSMEHLEEMQKLLVEVVRQSFTCRKVCASWRPTAR